eukprot:TRINITY_DN48055_c0_g1_i1.p1 TRINITY_DN48055_c0_g1~~TRINITY_DN48055_c0_g1_i1.p1  ORF type:complete len:223 (+),score=25.01 TRINITY_DN48055_c0_g1_i1:35-703(+)
MSAGNTVWVGGLPNNVDEETFRSIFDQYGSPISTKVFTDKWYGFVDFATPEEAQELVSTLDGAEFQGRILQVRLKSGGKGSASAQVSGWKSASQAWTQSRASPYESSGKGDGKPKGSSICVGISSSSGVSTGNKGHGSSNGGHYSGHGSSNSGQFSGSCAPRRMVSWWAGTIFIRKESPTAISTSRAYRLMPLSLLCTNCLLPWARFCRLLSKTLRWVLSAL